MDKDFKNKYTILQPGVIPPLGHGSLSYNTDTLQNHICPTINNIFEYQVCISTMQTENLLYGKRQDMMHDTKQILKFATLKRARKAWETDWYRWGAFNENMENGGEREGLQQMIILNTN